MTAVATLNLTRCPLCAEPIGAEVMATDYTDLWPNTDGHVFRYRACETCRVTVLVNPPEPGPVLGAFYAERGGCAFLDRNHPSRLVRAYTRSLQRRKLALLEAAVNLAPGSRVLEIGCAKGPFAALLAERGYEVHANDLDEAFRPFMAPGVTFHVGPFSAALFPPGMQFDCIVSHHVIEHVYDPLGFLAGCHALLKPGGVLVTETVNTECATYKLFGTNWGLLCAPRHTVLFTASFFTSKLPALLPFEDIRVAYDGYATSFSTLAQSLVHTLHLPMARSRAALALGGALMTLINPWLSASEQALGVGRSVITVSARRSRSESAPHPVETA